MQPFNYPWLRFFWVPFLAFLFNSLSWVVALTDDFAQTLLPVVQVKIPLDIFFSTLNALICSEGSLFLFRRVERLFPIEKRLKTLISIHVLESSALWFGMFTVSQAFLLGFDTPMKIFMYKQNLLFSLMIALCMNVVHIGMILFQRWKDAHSEAENLQRVHLESQNLALRQQIDPHFLFNSLNTLSAIIEDEPKMAVRFVQHLSEVYRYVLQSKNRISVSLQEEIEFVQAYAHLLELRFGENIEISIPSVDTTQNVVLPPLAIQLCIENAVKHNIISKSKPLSIVIKIDNETIIVENSLQTRSSEQPSTKIGLRTIRNHYSALTERAVTFTKTDSTFIVKLPLLRETVHSLEKVHYGKTFGNEHQTYQHTEEYI